MNADPVCVKAKDDAAGPGDPPGRRDGKSLANVSVYVKDGLGNYVYDPPTTPADRSERVPLPSARVRDAVGQALEIVNSDPTLHNIHALPKDNTEFNQGQPLQNMKMTHVFNKKEVMVPFKCDVHGWMNAYVGVLDHPYFAVSGADGKFSMATVPPGTYTIEAWHEAGHDDEKFGNEGVTFTFQVADRRDTCPRRGGPQPSAISPAECSTSSPSSSPAARSS